MKEIITIIALGMLASACAKEEASETPTLEGKLLFTPLSPGDHSWGEDGPPPPRDMCHLSIGDAAAILYVSGSPQLRPDCADGEFLGLTSHWEVPVTIAHHLGGPRPDTSFNFLMSDPRHTITPPAKGDHLLAAWFADQGAHFGSFSVHVAEDAAATTQPPTDYQLMYNFPTTVSELQAAYAELQTNPQTHCLSPEQPVAELRTVTIQSFRGAINCDPGSVSADEDNINATPGPAFEDDSNTGE